MDRLSEIGWASFLAAPGLPKLALKTDLVMPTAMPLHGLTAWERGSNMQRFGVAGTAISFVAAKREFLP